MKIKYFGVIILRFLTRGFDGMTGSGAGTKVVKGSGETEVFDPNIITTDCMEAGVEFWTAAEVAMEVSKDVYDGINSEEIQRKILSALYSRSPEVAERYKRFHSMYVRASSNTIERFDRKRVVNSLVKETHLPKEVAEIIARETESELRRLNLDFTSGPLIREIVNVKLLEHGYEGARSDYTRLGMPVYDAAQFIEAAGNSRESLQSPDELHREMAKSIFREYSLLKVFPLHLADAHMKGDMHVHDLEHFVTRPYTAYHDLRDFLKGLNPFSARPGWAQTGPSNNPESAVMVALKALLAFSSYFSGSQGLHSFNVWLAPYLEGLSHSQMYQLAQACLFEIAQTHSVWSSSLPPVDIEVEYGVPEHVAKLPALLPGGFTKDSIYYADFEEEAREFAAALTEAYGKGDFKGGSFGSPRLIYTIRGENEGKEGYDDFLGLVHEAASKGRDVHFLNFTSGALHPLSSAHSTGVVLSPPGEGTSYPGSVRQLTLQCTSYNLPRAAYRSGGKEERFFEELDDGLELVRDVARIKRDVISKRLSKGSLSFLGKRSEAKPYVDLDEAINLFSYVGLNEAVKAYLDEEIHESTYARDFGVKVLTHIHGRLSEWGKESGERWLLSSLYLPSVAKRFATLDSGQFTEVIPLKGGRSYTDSCHLSKESRTEPLKRMEMMSPYQSLSTGGLMETIHIGEPGAEDLLTLSTRLAKLKATHWRYAL